MDAKTVFLNENIDEKIYMVKLESFMSRNSKFIVYKLKKFIYSLNQASRQWYHKVYEVNTSFCFEVIIVEDCIYHKFSGSKRILR